MRGGRKTNSRHRTKNIQLDAMQKHLRDIPFSVLDLAPIVAGSNAGGAFARSLELARAVENFGYERIWYAEHHNMENIASSATAILIGYIAGGTKRIRVGSGGIMLPNHAPLMVAEQFGTLESLYPGRIDLGLGRAPGTDQLTSRALRRYNQAVDGFPADVVELRDYFEADPLGSSVKAIPGMGLNIPIWLLGSSTFSAQLAAMLGLPFAFASHFAPTYLKEALKLYRSSFKPSNMLKEPYAVACVNVMAAPTTSEAERLATSFYRMARGIITHERKPLQPPVDSMDGIWTEPEKAAVMQMMEYAVIGDPQAVRLKMEEFLEATQVDEIMVTSHIYDNADRIRSYELIAPFFKKPVSQ